MATNGFVPFMCSVFLQKKTRHGALFMKNNYICFKESDFPM
jgi:hypothetical protein